ncbi:hypothetical protein XccvBFoX4_gp41 [Xanthomonas phage FoX4]|uniref:Uncharacterized protein n=1 Tax=Xanthomonas phage FoX4 TaxID=2723900 RepID=A0A858WNB1_9CAUD|nr:hypothetical protein KNU97_gp41 [Xanthomonas phage FoX4]QJI52995.1 hypothetical protein XccvBFoX4_gp41 [Xanthomonas phage FoX4]
MPLSTLNELLAKALTAAQGKSNTAVAERIMLFPSVVDALASFVRREELQLSSVREVRRLTRELSSALRDIEMGHNPKGPSIEHTRAYYATVVQLKKALVDVERFTTPVTGFSPLGVQNEHPDDRKAR